jgi:Methionyl-tRNA formyltransferase
MEKVLLFGDSWGVPLLVQSISSELICGIVAAEIRPQYHDELARLAAAQHVPFLVQPRRQSASYDQFVDQVRALAPDLVTVNSYSMLLHSELLEIPRLGCLNLHPALLPKYRGSNPLQWVIINNERETGVTMHYMNSEFDAGDIIAQRRVPIGPEDTWLDVRGRVAAATRELLREEIPRVIAQTNNRTAQNESEACSFPRRRPEDGEIDWNESAADIHNLIRALVAPLPGAFYYVGGEKTVLDKYLSLAEVTDLKETLSEKLTPRI